MFTILSLLTVALSALALPVVDRLERRGCYNAYGGITVTNANTNDVIGTVYWNSSNTIQFTLSNTGTLYSTISCPGVQQLYVYESDAPYSFLGAVPQQIVLGSLSGDYLGSGNSNWAMLVSSDWTNGEEGPVYASNSFSDHVMSAAVETPMFTFTESSSAPSGTVGEVTLTFTNPDLTTVPASIFLMYPSGGSVIGGGLGITGDYEAYLNANAYNPYFGSNIPVRLWMNGYYYA